MLNLDGKVALITGASRGIGKEAAILLAKLGAIVVLNARSESNLQETARIIKEECNQEPILLAYDVSNYAEVRNAFLFIQKNFKRLDILVNNAGILDDALLGMVTEKQVTETMQVNTHAVIYHMQLASRLMSRRKEGTIINVSSIIGTLGNEGQVVYAASKSAVIGATKSAAKELAPINIRVNAIAPGFIDTDMTKSLPIEKYELRLNNIKMKRAGKPEEVANVILFLASDLSSYVTGQVIGVDGGMQV